MELKLTNTLSSKLEIFEPKDNKKIKIYVCGPTVYDAPHIGNGRALVVYDMLYRILCGIYGESSISYVRNITDIDDKIIARARERECSIEKLTEDTTKLFHEDCAYLNCITPSVEPKATEHIDLMIDIIKRLVARGAAYEVNGSVYFSTKSFSEYGKLAGRKLEDLIAGSRIEIDGDKRDASDFLLWKHSMDKDCVFESPWGAGRPGWHIECSAMSYKYLGEDFDIHGGGADLMFPHHTNEIAQSCSAFAGSHYARYWVHNGFLTVNGEKMSKSLGNFIAIRDIRQNNPKGEILRMVLLSTHYRTPLDYNEKSFRDMKNNLDYLYRSIDFAHHRELKNFAQLPEDFRIPLLNDMNIQLAFTYMLALANNINKTQNIEDINNLYSCGRFLGIFQTDPELWFKGAENNLEIEALIEQRKQAKIEKNWLEADKIREKLKDIGISIEDKSDGSTIWRKN